MKTLRIVLFGRPGTGKSTLLHRIQTNIFSPRPATVVLDLKKIVTEDESLTLYINDLSGNNKYSELTTPYLPNAELALYCIDLSAEVNLEEIQSDLQLFKNHNPTAILFLIGTKNDITLYSAEHMLSYINSQMEGFFSRSIITSAQTGEGRESLLEEFTNVGDGKAIIREQREGQTYISNKNRLFATNPFPDSYSTLFPKHSTTDEELMRGARNLLNDYTKGRLFFFSTLSRLLHGHINRHYIERVTQIVQDIDQGRIATPTDLINEFKSINPENREGSLARRIKYIRQEIFSKAPGTDDIPCADEFSVFYRPAMAQIST